MRKKVNKKLIVALLSFVLLFGGTFGSSLAWLLDSTEDVQNVFTTSDINITLTESDDLDLKMIPGHTIEKDPIVTVEAGSEDCWVFIKVEEKGGAVTVKEKDGQGGEKEVTKKFADFISYAIDPNNWKQLTDNDNAKVAGVYVTTVPVKDIENDRRIKVLGYFDDEENFVNNEVLVNGTVTKEMMEALGDNNKPSLTFTAYASQYQKNNDEFFTPYEAWKNLGN